MSIESLRAYLQDHAAGANAAIDLLHHIISMDAGTKDEAFFKGLRVEITEDKAKLEKILGEIGSSESIIRNTVTRIAEKFSRGKVLLAGPGHGDLGRLEALEMLSLGIEGKRGLWLALKTATIPKVRGVDLLLLAARATRQRRGVERRRLAAARHTLDSSA